MNLKERIAKYASKASTLANKAAEYTKVITSIGPTPSLYTYVGAAVQLLELGLIM